MTDSAAYELHRHQKKVITKNISSYLNRRKKSSLSNIQDIRADLDQVCMIVNYSAIFTHKPTTPYDTGK